MHQTDPIEAIREYAKIWVEDDCDLGWFLTSKEVEGMSERDMKMYQKGARAILKSVVKTFQDEDFIDSATHL